MTAISGDTLGVGLAGLRFIDIGAEVVRAAWALAAEVDGSGFGILLSPEGG